MMGVVRSWNRGAWCVLAALLAGTGCSSQQVDTPTAFDYWSQVPREHQGIAQKLMDGATETTVAGLDLSRVQGKRAFVEVNSDSSFGVENVRHAVIQGLHAAGASGVTYSTADADVVVAVNPSVYSFQTDYYDYNSFMWFIRERTVKQTATTKLNVAVLDAKSGSLLATSSREAFSTLERKLPIWFWFLERRAKQSATTAAGSSLTTLSITD